MAVALRKINFPSVVTAAYRGNISAIRTDLLSYAAWIDRSPGAKVDLLAQLSALITYIGGLVASIANAGAVNVVDSAATAEPAGVATVAGGALTQVALPSTDKIIKSTVKYLGPTPSGAWTNGYTFTIVNGAITAIVLS